MTLEDANRWLPEPDSFLLISFANSSKTEDINTRLEYGFLMDIEDEILAGPFSVFYVRPIA